MVLSVAYVSSMVQRQRIQRLDAIVFRNFYSSHITIKRRRQRFDPETAANSTAAAGGALDGDPWVTILRDRPLMENPHHEDDAQYWHVVTADEFDWEGSDAGSTAPLRSASQPRFVGYNGYSRSYRCLLPLPTAGMFGSPCPTFLDTYIRANSCLCLALNWQDLSLSTIPDVEDHWVTPRESYKLVQCWSQWRCRRRYFGPQQ